MFKNFVDAGYSMYASKYNRFLAICWSSYYKDIALLVSVLTEFRFLRIGAGREKLKKKLKMSL